MTGPQLQIVCSLPAAWGAAQWDAWRGLDGDDQLEIERAPGGLTVRYAELDDSIKRLTELIRERSRCTFTEWTIDTTTPGLQLTVDSTDPVLASLVLLKGAGR